MDETITLKKLIELFNADDENDFWDNFYLEVSNDGKPVDFDTVKLIPRNYCEIH